MCLFIIDKLLNKCKGLKIQIDVIYDLFSDTERHHSKRVLDIKIKEIADLRKDFRQHFLDIMADGTGEQQSEISALITEFEKVCSDSDAAIDIFIEDSEVVIPVNEDVSESKSSDTSTSTATSDTTSSKDIVFKDMKLPRIELPKFCGGYTEWVEFYDMFKCAIHDRKDMKPSQKMIYLKNSLEGEPAMMIRALPITDTNYNVAMNILLKRYDDKRTIIDAHLEKLFSLPYASKSAESIRHLLNSASEQVQALSLQGLETNKWNVLLVFMLKKRLDHEVKLVWERHVAELPLDKIDFNSMLEFLYLYARALEFSVDESKPKSGSGC